MPPSFIHNHLHSIPPRAAATLRSFQTAAFTNTQSVHESRRPARCPCSSSPVVALTAKSIIPLSSTRVIPIIVALCALRAQLNQSICFSTLSLLITIKIVESLREHIVAGKLKSGSEIKWWL